MAKKSCDNGHRLVGIGCQVEQTTKSENDNRFILMSRTETPSIICEKCGLSREDVLKEALVASVATA
jgi:hypothetical protein